MQKTQSTIDEFPADVIAEWRATGLLDQLIESGLIERPPASVRSMFNPHHDRRGRFATGGGGGGTFKAQRNAVEAKLEAAVDAHDFRALEKLSDRMKTFTPKPGDTIKVHHHGAIKDATVHRVNDDFSVEARLAHGAKVTVPPLSHKALIGLGVIGIGEIWGQPVTQRVFFNPYHGRDGRFAPRPAGATIIGVTPNRGPAREQLGELQPYFSTSRFKGFERHAREDAPDGVSVTGVHRCAGFWEGSLEPSAQVTVKGGSSETKAFATGLGKRYNQDGVVAFTPRKGGSQRLYRWQVSDPTLAVQALKDAGVMGATVRGNRVEVIDLFGSEGEKMAGLSTLLGHRGQVVRGDGWLWEKGTDYAATMTVMIVDTREV